jgi:DNA-binding transcriptional LysR family regulator
MNTPVPTWNHYGTFLAVMHGGSLSAAARAMSVAQPTVRRQIEEFEVALGAKLFTRSQSGLRPTPVADELLPYAETMAATAAAGLRTASGVGLDDVGTVRITCSEVLGVEVLPEILAEFRRAKPSIQIELLASNTSADLVRLDADIGIRMVRPQQSALVARKVANVDVGLYATKTYLKAVPPPLQPCDLASYPSLIGDDNNCILIDALAHHGISLRRENFAFRADSDLIQLAALRGGLGIGMCQIKLADNNPLFERVLPDLHYRLEAWVVMHEDLKRVPRVRAVYDFLATRVGEFYKT